MNYKLVSLVIAWCEYSENKYGLKVKSPSAYWHLLRRRVTEDCSSLEIDEIFELDALLEGLAMNKCYFTNVENVYTVFIEDVLS